PAGPPGGRGSSRSPARRTRPRRSGGGANRLVRPQGVPAGTHHGVPGSVPLVLLERSEEHTSELQSRFDLVCRLLLEKKKDTVLVLMLTLLVWLTPDLRITKSLLKCNWTIRKSLPRCKVRRKKRLLTFSRRLHARIRKTRYMHKMRCLLINRRSLLLALRLLWKTPIFPSNSSFFFF